jgi:aminoglycoside 3-N-acetyltransferase
MMDFVDKLPICKGDILYVISDILGMAKVCRDKGEKFECEKIIESLQQAVGDEGTLLFPTFNWDFCKGIAFDYNKTLGKTGALGNAALKMPRFKRTRHPLYSFAVWGKAQSDLAMLGNKSGFGDGSPFAYMHKNKAKALVIGLTASIGNSFMHYVEQMHNVSYRYEKDFKAPYIDENGRTEDKIYSMHVRDLEINPQHTSFAVIDKIMSELSICKDFTINSIPFHIIDLCGMFEVVSLDIRYNNSNNLYTFAKG